jgi:hypothetical protein
MSGVIVRWEFVGERIFRSDEGEVTGLGSRAFVRTFFDDAHGQED